MKKRTWIFAGIATTVLLAGVFLVQRRIASSKSIVEALGLRGTSKVSKPLSTIHQERLETHFLDIPAPTKGAPSAGPASVMNTINQVEAINKLNERQTQ